MAEATRSVTLRAICHNGITASEAILARRPVGPKAEERQPHAMGPFGSRTIWNQTNIGMHNRIQTGSSIDWASLSVRHRGAHGHEDRDRTGVRPESEK